MAVLRWCPDRLGLRADAYSSPASSYMPLFLVGSGYVFATPVGEPINPNTDYHHWKRLLADAGLRDGRLHDARHTAATVLLILGVPERAVMGIMGWSTTAMAARYQHVTGVVRGDAAQRVGGLIWGAESGK